MPLAHLGITTYVVSDASVHDGQKFEDMLHTSNTASDVWADKTVEHPFGTLKMRMGATHFLMKRLPKVATEMALHVLAYNLTRVMNILGVKPLIAAIQT